MQQRALRPAKLQRCIDNALQYHQIYQGMTLSWHPCNVNISNFTTCFVQLLQWWHRRTSSLPASITLVILVLPWMTPLRCSDAGVDIVDQSCYKPRYQSGFCTRIIHNQIRWCKHWWWCRNSWSKVKDKVTRWQTTSTDGGFMDERSDWMMVPDLEMALMVGEVNHAVRAWHLLQVYSTANQMNSKWRPRNGVATLLP